jgi:hypothetical protein
MLSKKPLALPMAELSAPESAIIIGKIGGSLPLQ